jgi:transposase
MATLEQLGRKPALRVTRYFSVDFKKKKVDELDKRITTISDICKEYQLSATAVYKWIYKYSLMRKKGVKMVVEPQSDTAKIKALKQHISQLEQLLGQKEFELEFLQKQMEIASEQYGIDLKKKLSGKL